MDAEGGIVRTELQNFMQSELLQRGYNPVFTPHIGSIELYKNRAISRITRRVNTPPLRRMKMRNIF